MDGKGTKLNFQNGKNRKNGGNCENDKMNGGENDDNCENGENGGENGKTVNNCSDDVFRRKKSGGKVSRSRWRRAFSRMKSRKW